MNYREEVREGRLYSELNKLLREHFSKICKSLNQKLKLFLRQKHYSLPFEAICRLEQHTWEQVTQWRVEIDFDDYELDYETLKPHYLGAFVSLEEVKGFSMLIFNFKIYNSFNSELAGREDEHINIQQLNDDGFVDQKLKEVKAFVKKLEDSLMKEIEKVDFNLLEYVEE